MIKRFKWRVNRRNLITELNGLKRADQLVKCVHDPATVGQYFIYMKPVLERGLAQVGSMVAEYKSQGNGKDPYVILHDKIRDKAIEYAVHRKIGHRDIQRKNVRTSGSSLETLVVDLVDWSTWDEIHDDPNDPTLAAGEIEVYVGSYLVSSFASICCKAPGDDGIV